MPTGVYFSELTVYEKQWFKTIFFYVPDSPT